MKTLKDFSVTNKRVLVRCDFNVPIDEKGNILDDFRITKTIPTIKYLIEQKAKVILMSHLGDPEGKVVPGLKLDKIAEKLAELLNTTVGKEEDCIGPDLENETNILDGGKVLLLENLRFHKEELDSDMDFAKKLSFLGDIYVNDAFGVSHRNNASITGVPQFLPCCAGLLLEKEITNLEKIMNSAEKPLIVIIGGKKVETKAKFIEKMSDIADYIIVSGLIKKEADEKNFKFKYPEKIIAPLSDLAALDIKDDAIELFVGKIKQAKTILWNGPFGKFEDEKYAKGTLAIANAIIESNAFSVLGGGETVEFVNKHGMIDKFDHVSTGGGAMLAFLSGEELPGIKALGK